VIRDQQNMQAEGRLSIRIGTGDQPDSDPNYFLRQHTDNARHLGTLKDIDNLLAFHEKTREPVKQYNVCYNFYFFQDFINFGFICKNNRTFFSVSSSF
jgi:hypothetical protein